VVRVERAFSGRLAVGHFDVFWLRAVLGVLLVFLVLVMKRSVAEKGGHVGAE